MSGKRPTLLILGAASDIGRAIARVYGAAGYDLILAARGVDRLEAEVTDLKHRCQAQAVLAEWDALAPPEPFLDRLASLPDIAVCVVGLLGDQKTAEQDDVLADLVMRSNYNGPALILGALAHRMAQRGSGAIIGISSVAGDRGRASNYIYGSAKAGFTAFLSGLRNRLAKSGVTVLTVKPGFVDTAMTAGMKLPKPLTAQPQQVAAAILRAQQQGKDVLYVLPIWRLIMLIIGLIPESLFKKTNL